MNTIQQHPGFPSQYVLPRQIDVWLPPTDQMATNQRYPVLYMHDGQNLFDRTIAYGGEHWGVAEALLDLISKELAPPVIIVGIWNTERRWTEYLPQRPFPNGFDDYLPAHLKQLLQQKLDGHLPQSDSYLRFLTRELKPFIDQTYPTRPEQNHTFIMGSSMGGLISMYALCEYPDLFAGAGCLSTHWPAGEHLLLDYLAHYLPAPDSHTFYFDYGTETLDAAYEPWQKQADTILNHAGYTQNKDYLTRRFAGAAHNEFFWRQRVHIPLAFLLGGKLVD